MIIMQMDFDKWLHVMVVIWCQYHIDLNPLPPNRKAYNMGGDVSLKPLKNVQLCFRIVTSSTTYEHTKTRAIRYKLPYPGYLDYINK